MVTIKDKNLYLALLDETADYDKGLLNGSPYPWYADEAETEEFLIKEVGLTDEELAAWQEGWVPIKKVESFFLKQTLKMDLLLEVARMSFDGDRQIYSEIFPNWMGATDDFDIMDLTGIENLKNLNYIGLGAMLQSPSLLPLESLPNLEEMFLSYDNGPEYYKPLLNIKRLKKVELINYHPKNEQDKSTMDTIFNTLRNNGVNVIL
jgi:hypothetical protein